MRKLSKDLKQARFEAKARVREPLAALNSEHFEAVKSARQNSGLWWGNYNAIVASYETARTKAMKENAELRFRRFTGEGRFTVQIVGGASVQEITRGSKQVSIDLTDQPVPGRGGKPRPRLAMTIYTREGKPRLLTWPLIYDRPLPEASRVQQVVVTRRKVGTKWRYAAVFICRVERPAVTSTRVNVCGVNLGFRQTPDGLRIATLYDGSRVEHVHLPSRWMEGLDKVETICQRRDLALNEIHQVLKAQWPQAPGDLPDAFAKRLTTLVRAPKFSAASLAWVVLRWSETAPQWWPPMLERLEAWRRIDKRKHERQANDRDHLMMVRREQYRLFARSLASRYGVIRIGRMELRKMAQLETAGGEENELHQRARRNRARAALYSLQQEQRLQAEKFGTRIEVVDGPVTVTCHECGSRCAVTSDLIHVCEHCSAVWDQDENASRNIFATPGECSNDEGTPRGANRRRIIGSGMNAASVASP